MRLLFVPGLPIPGVASDDQARKQFGPLYDAFSHYPGVTGCDSINLFGDRIDKKTLAVLKDGSLGDSFRPAFEQQLLVLHQEEPRVIIAFSAGGWVVYKWLERATSAQISRITAAILIGSPHKNHRLVLDDSGSGTRDAAEAEYITLPGRERPTGPLAPWRTDLSFAKATPSPSLHVALSLIDESIHPVMAAFERDITIEARIEVLQLKNPTHLDLTSNRTIAMYVQQALAGALATGP